MDWRENLLERLHGEPCCGYQPEAPPATEPTALAALALAAHGERSAARLAADWLAVGQATDGSLGIDREHQTPRWPTSLAVLAWQAVDRAAFTKQIERAVHWMLTARGETMDRDPALGHDTRLAGWPWVLGTHSWVEPTALHVRALQATGHHDHPRCREAVRLLQDRQLPRGGWNYGNPQVLGQTLLPHVQPTGIALWALTGEPDQSEAIRRASAYLQSSLSARTTTTSLCWALLGLAAHGHRPAEAGKWIEAACRRIIRRDPAGHRCALLALAASVSVPPATDHEVNR